MTKKLWLIGAFLALIVVLYFYELQYYLTIDTLKAYQSEYSAYYNHSPASSLLIYSLLFIALTIISVPATAVLTVAAGALFGFVPGVLISLFSALTGAVLAFLIARHLLGENLQKKYCEQLKQVNEGIEKDGNLYLFSLRVMPIMPFCLINFLMGLTRMKLLQYVGVTAFGVIFWIVIYVYAGTTLRKIKAIEDIMSIEFILALMLLGLFPWLMRQIMPRITEKKRKKRLA